MAKGQQYPKRAGFKYSKRELDNEEEEMAIRKPGKRRVRLQDQPTPEQHERIQRGEWPPDDEDVDKQERDKRLQTNAAYRPEDVRKGRRTWISDKHFTPEQIMSGEVSESEGKWVYPEEKRRAQPRLIDQLIHATEHSIWHGPHKEPAKLKLLQAQRFVLDGQASIFFGNVVHQFGNEVLKQHEFARAPYPLTWIEFDSQAYCTVVPHTVSTVPDDQGVGFLYDNDTVWCASHTNEGDGMFLPWRVQLHRPSLVEDEMRNCEIFGVDRIRYRMGLLGDMAVAKEKVLDPKFWMGPEISTVVQSHRMELMPDFVEALDAQKTSIGRRQQILWSCGGVLKQIIVLLLIMTRPNKHVFLVEEPVGARRVFVRNKQVPMVSYTKITMHLEQKDALRHAVEHHTGIRHKHHDVKGHWAESRRKGRQCPSWPLHSWVMIDKDHAECGLGCGARKWWRIKHTRGDIHLGSVAKTYEVTE